MFERLVSYWVYGGALAGVLLFALSPLLLRDWPQPLAITFMLLPAYMIHQYEEHESDRFRLFFNQTMGGGFEVLSPVAVFMTNVPLVWGVISLSLYGAARVNIGFAFVAACLVLVNAAVHLVYSLVFRRYNPGLVSAVVVFIPLGILALTSISRGGGSTREQVLAFAIALVVHASILLYAQRRLRILKRSACTPSRTMP